MELEDMQMSTIMKLNKLKVMGAVVVLMLNEHDGKNLTSWRGTLQQHGLIQEQILRQHRRKTIVTRE